MKPLFDYKKYILSKKHQYATYNLYLKVTDRCNLNCDFCYNKNRMSLVEKYNVDKYSNLIKNVIINPLTKIGFNHFQVIFHGGEFTLIGREKLERIIRNLNLLQNAYIFYNGMSNLQSRLFKKEFLNKYSEINFSTSFNKFMANANWLESVLYTYYLQNRTIHLNRIFKKNSELDINYFDVLQKLDYKLREIDLINKNNKDSYYFTPKGNSKYEFKYYLILKYERYLDPNKDVLEIEKDFYYKNSLFLINIFEEILKDNDLRLLKHAYTNLIPYIVLNYCKEFNLDYAFKGFFCGIICSIMCLIVDTEFNLGFCTKKFNETKITKLPLNKKEYLNFDIKNEIVNNLNLIMNDQSDNCRDCEYVEYCMGHCQFVPPFDETGECANCKLVLDYFKKLPKNIRYKFYKYLNLEQDFIVKK